MAVKFTQHQVTLDLADPQTIIALRAYASALTSDQAETYLAIVERIEPMEYLASYRYTRHSPTAKCLWCLRKMVETTPTGHLCCNHCQSIFINRKDR